MRPLKLYTAFCYFVLTATIYLTSCYANRTPETFLIPENYKGEICVVHGQENGSEKEYENKRRVYRIPLTGILFTRFKYQDDGILDQQFYYVTSTGKRNRIWKPDTREFNYEGIRQANTKEQSKDSLAVFDGGYGNISDGKTTFTIQEYFIGTYNEMKKSKEFTFEHIDSLRNMLTKNGMQQRIYTMVAEKDHSYLPFPNNYGYLSLLF